MRTPGFVVSLEVLGSIWDWLWIKCTVCGWDQAEHVRRGKPVHLPSGFGIGPCSCGSSSFVVLERRPHPNFLEEELAPRPLPVVA